MYLIDYDIENELEKINSFDYNEYKSWIKNQPNIYNLDLSNYYEVKSIFDYYKEINIFLKTKVIKPTLITNKWEIILNKPIINKLFHHVFWKIIIIKIYPYKFDKTNKKLKKIISKTIINLKLYINNEYNKIQKDHILNLIQFILGYLIILLIFKFFNNNNDLVNLRFCFDIFHLIVWDFQGIYITDSFIKKNLRLIFLPNSFNFIKKNKNNRDKNIFEENMSKKVKLENKNDFIKDMSGLVEIINKNQNDLKQIKATKSYSMYNEFQIKLKKFYLNKIKNDYNTTSTSKKPKKSKINTLAKNKINSFIIYNKNKSDNKKKNKVNVYHDIPEETFLKDKLIKFQKINYQITKNIDNSNSLLYQKKSNKDEQDDIYDKKIIGEFNLSKKYEKKAKSFLLNKRKKSNLKEHKFNKLLKQKVKNLDNEYIINNKYKNSSLSNIKFSCIHIEYSKDNFNKLYQINKKKTIFLKKNYNKLIL